MSAPWTPGPWPWDYTGDGKRIVVGEGLVEGPNGYEVAEVYSDDCPKDVAEANANLIAAAPDLAEVAIWADQNADNQEISHEAFRVEIAVRLRSALAKAKGETA